MDRYHNLLNELAEAAQKTYKGQKRSELKDSDFLFPETRSFPIVTPQDIPDAISNFGRMKGDMSYDAFIKKLYQMAKRKGAEFVAALPETTKDKLGIKSKSACDDSMPDLIVSQDPTKLEYQMPVNEKPEEENEEEPEDEEEEEEEDDVLEMEIEKLEKQIEIELLKQKLVQIKQTKGEDFTNVEKMEEETLQQEMMEYKNDFYTMSLGSIKSIAMHAQAIVKAAENNTSVAEALTESWLQGKIAVTEDYMTTIHNFVMFGKTETDTEGSEAKQKRPGLWENIRKKREKMGKNYKPAKPGDKDRPDPEAWKKAQ